MITLEEVAAFQEIVVSKSFTAAARKLNLTQSTISHQIRRLEERLGQQLLERTTRHVKLTFAGERFLPHAKKLLEQARVAENCVMESDLSGEVRIGISEEFACKWLPELLSRFRINYPNISLTAHVGISQKLSHSLKQRELDLVVAKVVPYEKEALAKDQLVWVGKKDILKQSSLPVAFFPAPCAYRHIGLETLSQIRRNYSLILTTTSHESLIAIARRGVALTIFTRHDCPPDLVLNHDELDLPALPFMGYSINHKTNPNPQIKAVAKITLQILQANILK